jgi:hypothetical protein
MTFHSIKPIVGPCHFSPAELTIFPMYAMALSRRRLWLSEATFHGAFTVENKQPGA